MIESPQAQEIESSLYLHPPQFRRSLRTSRYIIVSMAAFSWGGLRRALISTAAYMRKGKDVEGYGLEPLNLDTC